MSDNSTVNSFSGYITKAQYRGVSYYSTIAGGSVREHDLPLAGEEVAADHSLALYGLKVGSIIGINGDVKKIKMFIEGPKGPGIYTNDTIEEGYRILYVLKKAG